jgi:hypothetical protein
MSTIKDLKTDPEVRFCSTQISRARRHAQLALPR